MGTIIETLSDVISHIGEYWNSIIGIFSDVDFSVLYNWLPFDIRNVCAAFIAAIIFIAFIGLLKKLLLFLG